MICPKCSSEMSIVAIITSVNEIKNILRHLARTGKSPQVFQEIYDFYSFDVLSKVFVLPARGQVCSKDKIRQAGFTSF